MPESSAAIAAPPEVLRQLDSWSRTVIIGHVVPDADCLGSMFALAAALPNGEDGTAVVSLPENSLSQRLTFLWERAGVSQFFFEYVPGFTPEVFANVQQHYEQWNFWIVFVAAFTPIPYKVITITAGVFGIGFPIFLLASAIGRSARFYLVAFLLHRYGQPIQRVLDKYLGLITLAIAAVGLLGFVALKYVF